MNGPVAALGEFVEREFPRIKEEAQAPPWLTPYVPYAQGGCLSLEFFPEEGTTGGQYCRHVADVSSEIFSESFAAGDAAFAVVRMGSSFEEPGPSDTDERPTSTGDRVDLGRFTERVPPQAANLGDDLQLLESVLGEEAVGHGEWVETVVPSTEADAPGEYHVLELVCAIAPESTDHHRMFLATAHQDFPTENHPRWQCEIKIINATRPLILDLADDRYLGVSAPRPEALLPIYERYAHLLNEHRRTEMTEAFGFWPKLG